MSVNLKGDRIRIGCSRRLTLRVGDMPELWRWHADGDPLTAIIDRAAARFVRADFPPTRAFLLVRTIYAWGGLRGANPDRVANSCAALKPEGLSKILKAAHGYSLREKYDCAIAALHEIKGMRVSFHSKILRFLSPDHAAILDSRIVENCGYPPTPVGYADFVRDCREIGDYLNKSGVCRTDGRLWRATDVEMAIFATIKKRAAKPPEKAS